VNKLLLTLALLASAGVVRAQEYIPPPIVAPAPWQPFNYQLDEELAARGHRNKIAGAVLIAAGSLVLAAGQGLVIWAGTHNDAGMIAGGAVTAFAGLVMNLIGIPVYVVGGSQVKRARHHLRASASGLRLEF